MNEQEYVPRYVVEVVTPALGSVEWQDAHIVESLHYWAEQRREAEAKRKQ